MWIELHTTNERKLNSIKHVRYKLNNRAVGVFAGLGVDDLDVDLHEVGGGIAGVGPAPARGLSQLAFITDAGVRGKTGWPNLPAELYRLLQSENLNKHAGLSLMLSCHEK